MGVSLWSDASRSTEVVMGDMIAQCGDAFVGDLTLPIIPSILDLNLGHNPKLAPYLLTAAHMENVSQIVNPEQVTFPMAPASSLGVYEGGVGRDYAGAFR
jgi:hypothetical protein